MFSGSKKNFNFFLIFFLEQHFFLSLRTLSNVNVLHKGLPLQEWVSKLGLIVRKCLKLHEKSCLKSHVQHFVLNNPNVQQRAIPLWLAFQVNLTVHNKLVK